MKNEKNNFRILVVDDEKVVRQVCQLSLQKSGYEVETAENGMIALEKLRANNDMEIVITDLKMAGLSGLELLQAIKRDYPHIEVIIMTGYATIENAIEAMKIGAYDFILKPLKPDQIRMAVNKCVDKIRLSNENFQLRNANEKLRDLQVMKDKFLAITSHELRTPVSHIKGYFAILNDEVYTELSQPEREEIIHVINSAIVDLEEIVTNMYDLLQLERQQQSLSFEGVDLNELMHQIAVAFNIAITNEKRKLTVDWQKNSQLSSIKADRLKVKMLISELVQNAIKFTPDGGKIFLSAREEDNFCVVSVKDTGIGIPPGKLGMIFEKFYEVENTDNHHTDDFAFMGGGLGLGLPFARAIAEAHKGGIKVISDPMVGSEFLVFLPKEQSQNTDGSERRA